METIKKKSVLVREWIEHRGRGAVKLLCVILLCSVAQSCLTLSDPVNCSPPSSSVHGILQAGILEQVAISSSRGSSPPRDQTGVSCIGRRGLHPRATWEAS